MDSTKTKLIKQLSELYADINVLHPFREGNGRTQRILFEHIAINCGYTIDWGFISMQEWMIANAHGAYCDFELLETIFQSALNEIK